MGLCDSCGLVQAVTDDQWSTESQQIYTSYEIYHQGGGLEQTVFNPGTGIGRARSGSIVEGLLKAQELPKSGRLLDIGCGNGAFLRAFGRRLPQWRLNGSEFDTRHKPTVEAIPRVERFYSGSLEDIQGSFDLISLVHVLEHISGPTAFLSRIRKLIKPGGLLLIEVPDCKINPFFLVVADHASHFSPASLSAIVTKAGFNVCQAGDMWVAKEISLIAKNAEAGPTPAPGNPRTDAEQTFGNWVYLKGFALEAERAAGQGQFGIFGTSIAATWLNAQLGRAASFFVDEDPNRVGKMHEQRPIYAVKDIPAQASVFIALPTQLAKMIAARLGWARPDVKFVAP